MLEVVIPLVVSGLVSVIGAIGKATQLILREIKKPNDQIKQLDIKIDKLDQRIQKLEKEHK